MSGQTIPADDGTREPTISNPDDGDLTHLSVVGDTYTILISGADTAGHYTLLDMLIPAGGGPPPHRHDFDEMFHVLDGQIEVTVRGDTSTVKAGETVNVPSLAPHSFGNKTESTVRLLCLAAPSGLDKFFAEIGDPVASRTAPAPELSEEEKSERMKKAVALADKYHVEVL